MKIALVEGRRHNAEPNLSGKCLRCGSNMVPKCGERRVWHWAHRGVRHCDHWWEPETEWHRSWKNRFPTEWQEIVHRAENGEKHIADVKTPQGEVIEFQHSYLKPAERRSREAFYNPMFWVVNGLRRKRDKQTFYKALRTLQVIRPAPLTILVPVDECALLREWIDSCVAVYFDFGFAPEDISLFGVPVLWRLSPGGSNGRALLSPIPAANFIEAFLNGVPVKGINAKAPEGRVKLRVRIPNWRQPIPRTSGPESFEQYIARKHRARSRRRF
jgi:hypothetical protein